MAARHDVASPAATGRTLLALIVIGAIVTFAWLVMSLATAAFGG